ncbi:MAG: putative flippase GtrA [Natronomonas sp.]|jgi:putative flippase GtrA|uniref:GtrA family protein n=1 Tax=Natronomonas sp. TaxID=2184060 RepID=UPI003989B4A2
MVRRQLRLLVEGPAAIRLRRFIVVGAVAAGIQIVLLWLLVEQGGLDYLIAAVFAIETTIIFQYILNNAWTFHASRKTGQRAYLYGLFKTNLVRGTAIPIQLVVLYGLVSGTTLHYIIANAAGIVISGVYRYVLDSRWTWR